MKNKHMTHLIIAIVIQLFYASIYVAESNATQIRNCSQTNEDGSCYVYRVSIIELIGNPYEYHNKRVRFVGYLIIEFEGDSVFVRKEDYDLGLTKNGLWISIDSEDMIARAQEYSNKYVIIEGTYDAFEQGHMGLFSGGIHHIDRIGKWLSRSELERILK